LESPFTPVFFLVLRVLTLFFFPKIPFHIGFFSVFGFPKPILFLSLVEHGPLLWKFPENPFLCLHGLGPPQLQVKPPPPPPQTRAFSPQGTTPLFSPRSALVTPPDNFLSSLPVSLSPFPLSGGIGQSWDEGLFFPFPFAFIFSLIFFLPLFPALLSLEMCLLFLRLRLPPPVVFFFFFPKSWISSCQCSTTPKPPFPKECLWFVWLSPSPQKHFFCFSSLAFYPLVC